jgi:hypothetical protein
MNANNTVMARSPRGIATRTMALTASAPRNRPPRYSALLSGEVKSSGSISAATSRVAAPPNSTAVTSIPNNPGSMQPWASIAGALA